MHVLVSRDFLNDKNATTQIISIPFLLPLLLVFSNLWNSLVEEMKIAQ
jgi:hypothetical protein